MLEIKEGKDLQVEIENIDFSAIGAKLCGKKLTNEQQEDVNKLHDVYEKVNEIKQ